MALKRCDGCGLPLRLSRGYVWPGNGTIFARRDPLMRMVFFEADYYRNAWSELERALDLPISEVMIRGQRASAQDYVESNILVGWRKHLLPRVPSNLMLGRIIDETALFGFGRVEIMDYRKGRYMVMRLRNIFDIISMAWGVAGVYQMAEGKTPRIAWTQEGEDYILTLSSGERQSEFGDVDLETLRQVRKAKRELALGGKTEPPHASIADACPGCGLPSALAELEWREEEGAIYYRGTEARFIFSTGHIFLGVIRELERIIGRELDTLVLDITRRYHLKGMKGIPVQTRDEAYRSASRYLFAGGYGEFIESTYGEGHLEMVIANPFYPPRLVGRIAGLFEHVEGEEADVSYNCPEPQRLELEIRTT